MTDTQSLFETIVTKFEKNHEGVAAGKMMSSPALKYKGKVFAFFYKEEMGFKLGKDFEPDTYGLKEWNYLSPFKNKPPMKAWFVISETEQNKWEDLTLIALNLMRGS